MPDSEQTEQVWRDRIAKRVIASLATGLVGLTLTAGWAVGQTTPGFEDVPRGHIAETAINWAAANGITAGVGNSRFGMGQTLTRYQMVTFLCRAFDPDACGRGSTGSDRFVDVPVDHWANFSIGWAVEEGITSGTGPTQFGGAGMLTREQMVTFLYRAKGSPTGGPAGSDFYNDVPSDPSHWASTSIGWAYQNGVTGGIAGGVFGFGASLSREEMVLFLCRAVAPDVCGVSQSPLPSAVTTTTTTTTTTTAPSETAACDFPDHAIRVSEAVYQVHTTDGIGTAFYIGNDEWLTAAHVVQGERSVTLRREGVSLTAGVVGSNVSADLAMLRVPGSGGIRALGFGELSAMVPGHWVFSVGYPVYVASQPSVTRGILSRTEVDAALGNLVVTDAANSPGNSGGPLLNECGEVIGLVVQKVVGEGIEGISYAVAESTLRQRLPGLRAGQSGDGSPADQIGGWVYFSGETNDGTYEGYRLAAAGNSGYTWDQSPNLFLRCGISDPDWDSLFITTEWLIFGERDTQEVLVGYSLPVMEDPEIEWWWSDEDFESAVFADQTATQLASWLGDATSGSLVVVIRDRWDDDYSMWFEIDGAVNVLDDLDCW